MSKLTNSTRIRAKYGDAACLDAYRLTLDGSGVGYVAACLNVKVNTADALINVGRELANNAEVTSRKGADHDSN